MISKKKVGLIRNLTIIILLAILPFIYFMSLDIYVEDQLSNLIYKASAIYQYDGGLSSSYSAGELKSGKIIGRVKGKSFFRTFFWGPKIVKLQDYDGKEVILVREIMRQDVYMEIDN